MATKKTRRGRPFVSPAKRKVKSSICLSGWLMDYVDKHAGSNRSGFIEEALIKRHKLKAPE